MKVVETTADRIAAVIVLYFPTPAALENLRALVTIVDSVVIVINGGEAELTARLHSLLDAAIISNPVNVGLATALNQGIAAAFEDEETGYVLLLDQDSKPRPDMASRLREAYAKAVRAGENPACVAPRLVEAKVLGEAVYGRARKAGAARAPQVVATSGSLIGRDAFSAVGPMRDDLFIDGIDHEWCFRAGSLGYSILVEAEAIMDHDMGDAGVTVFGRYRPVYRSPVRHHYIVRNTIFLLRLPHIPLRWKLSEAAKTVYRAPVYLCLSTDKPKSFSAMVSGVLEGLSMPTTPPMSP